jgi:hypothetical protein
VTYANLRRRAAAPPAQSRSQYDTIAAPTAGWVTAINLAKAGRKTAALKLDNFFPLQTGIRPRGGRRKVATLGDSPVERVFHFVGDNADKLFAADSTAIYDITAPADPDTAIDPAVDGLSSGYFSTQLFTTSGGTFLVAVNGADLLLLYSTIDGWVPITGTATVKLAYDGQSGNFTVGDTVTGGSSGATGTILIDRDAGTSGVLILSDVSGTFTDNEALADEHTGAALANGTQTAAGAAITGVDTDKLSHVWAYRNRLFFIEGGTLKAHYLSVDSIGGALGTRSLGGIFKNGGSLLFGATWSLDAGDGIDDKCVFVTDKGEMAVFQGSDPSGSDPGDFDLVGRYDITVPLGKNATMSAGGDLLVLAEDGMVPVSAAINKDAAALSLSAVTRPIEPEWQKQVQARSGTPWEIVKWPSRNMAVVSVPRATNTDDPYCFVVNVETGAWGRYTNWDVRSLDVFRDRLYFGDRGGLVHEGEIGGADGDTPYTAVYVGHAEHFGAPGSTKIVHSMRSVFTASVAFAAKLSVSTDYVISLPSDPNPAMATGEGWDLSKWDVGVWDAEAPPKAVKTRWVSIGRTGFAIHPQVQIGCSATVAPDAQLVSLDILYERAGLMV